MNNPSTYEEIFPKHPALKKLIKLYYVHTSTDPKYDQEITYYPNYVTSLNIYQNSSVKIDEYSRTHHHTNSDRLLKLLVTKFEVSRKIIMKGPFNKISVVFHPLGLNHFLKTPPSQLSSHYCHETTHFGAPLDRTIEQVYLAEKMQTKRDLLDTFFLENLIGFQEIRLYEAVEKIMESTGTISIQQLASEQKISRKTLLRLFTRHMSYTPSEFKSIVKFRYTLNQYHRKKQKPNLTTLAYEGNYYDQSDLNFHIKNRTGLTPKQLLPNIQTIAEGLYWKMESVPKVQS